MTPTAINDSRNVSHTTAPASHVRADAPVALSVDHLSKTYPIPLNGFKKFFRLKTKTPVVALTDVSFQIREGEVFGLIGRNGAGKTTLAKIVATLVQPTSGHVTVRGYDSVRDEESVRSQIGLASAEERSFYWRLTVEQNMSFFARLYGLTARVAAGRITELLAQFEMEELRRRRFGELSTGNKQRLAVARALLKSPPVLLLDEPTRSLDPVAAARMRALIGALARQSPPVTVLLTSHNLAEIEELCERVAVISRGRIRAIDSTQNLRQLHRQHASVRLTVGGMTEKIVRQKLGGEFENVETFPEAAHVILRFAREAGDDKLDRMLRRLLEAGAEIFSCETEHSTLLDVLESFELEAQTVAEKTH